MTGESPGSAEHLAGAEQGRKCQPAGGSVRVKLGMEGSACPGAWREWAGGGQRLSLLPCSVLRLCCPEITKEALE